MKIGIAVDGSSPSRAGVDLVASMPLRSSDRVSVISVARPPVFLAGAPFGQVAPVAGYVELLTSSAQERARVDVEHAVEHLIGLPCPVTPVILLGHPVESLIRVASESDLDLLVLGARGLGSVDSILLGSVSQSLLHAMPTSILIARPPTGAPRRVILAVDGSLASIAAATFLRAFPLPSGVAIHVLVSVTSGSEEYQGIEAPDYRALCAAEREHAHAIAQRAVDLLEATGRHPVALIREGDPKREILDAALLLDTDLIVTGARGVGGFKGHILGSVSRGVSKAAPCSTLVVGGPKAAAAGAVDASPTVERGAVAGG
jgi:nucleotide-binding universal stress UspA family protein